MRLSLCVILVLCAGCSDLNEELLIDDLRAESLETRLAATASLRDIDSPESVRGLLEAFADRPDSRQETASALVMIGRRWYVDNPKPGTLENPVILGLSILVPRGTLDADLRGKAVWVMCETTQPLPAGSKIRREVEAYIGAADASDSTLVGKEKAISRDKMGFTSKGRSFECLPGGKLLASYDPVARGHTPKED